MFDCKHFTHRNNMDQFEVNKLNVCFCQLEIDFIHMSWKGFCLKLSMCKK